MSWLLFSKATFWPPSIFYMPVNFLFERWFMRRQEQKNSFLGVFFHQSDVCTLFENHQNVPFEFSSLAFSINFCPIKIDLYGNTVFEFSRQNSNNVEIKLANWSNFAYFETFSIWLFSLHYHAKKKFANYLGYIIYKASKLWWKTQSFVLEKLKQKTELLHKFHIIV